MPEKLKRARLGVIIGRFQVDNISKGHKELIEEVLKLHDRVLILLGCSPVPAAKENPLDYATREKMIRDEFGGKVTCLPLMDQPSNEGWSVLVDSTVRTIFPIGSVCIYGGRDSFLPYYSGSMDASEFPASDYRPATEIRETIGNMVPSDPAGRRGVIYSTQNQFPRAFVCIDAVVYRPDTMQIIAGKRPQDHGLWRLPGGFVDPGEALEAAVRREVREEVGCAVDNIKYICSRDTEDWRFKKGTDRLTTVLFSAQYVFGPTQGGDDLPHTFWAKANQINIERFIPGHRPLVEAFTKEMRW